MARRQLKMDAVYLHLNLAHITSSDEIAAMPLKAGASSAALRAVTPPRA